MAKLLVLDKYLWAYLNIVGDWSSPAWYIDTHAGTGRTNPFGDDLEMKGSALIALEHDFDKYWFFEDDETHFETLCETIEAEEGVELEDSGEFFALPKRSTADDRITIVNGDSNKGAQMLVEKYDDRSPWFIFIDPERVRDLKKETVLKLINRETTDVLINFQTTGYVRSGAENADHAWEQVEDGIGQDFPKDGSPDDFVDHFKENVIEEAGYSAKSRKMVSESDDTWRYDLVFAAGPKVATKIMADVMNKSLRDEITEKIVEARQESEGHQVGIESYSISIEEHNDNQADLEEFL